MIRQTDNVRVLDRCKKETRYLTNNDGCYRKINNCVYLENDQCVLNFCVRKEIKNGLT